MSKLQKAAWFNLFMTTAMCLLAALGFAVLARLNARGGLDDALIFSIAMLVGTPTFCVLLRKKGLEAGFDEREKMVYWRAFILAAMVLTVFLACICTIPFFVLGGRNVIRVYYLPLIFVSTLFVAQFAHSMAILIQCEFEDDNG